MKIIVCDDYEQMSVHAAKKIADIIRKKPDCVLGLATGSTPRGLYRELVRMHQEGGLDFSRVITFNLDEYLGIGMDLSKPYKMDQSYARFMYEELFKHINIDLCNTHVPNGVCDDPEAFCIQYEDEIRKVGGIDIQVLGIGGDGHWAFNEPGTSLASRTHISDLTKQTLDDNYDLFYGPAGLSRDQMPSQAITMGIGTILEAKALMMLANGDKKASVVAKAIEGPVCKEITASAVQLFDGHAEIVLDIDAAIALNCK